MSQLQSREPGTVGAALASERLFCGLIADGRHVADLSLRVAYKALGADRLCLVSDAMPSVGTDMESFPLLGKTVYVRDGRLMLADGTLAGAHLSMIEAVRYMVEHVGTTLAEALRMASTTPARCLGLEAERGRIVPGQKVDLVALDRRRTVIATWIDGREEKA
jgi:N-acetylglucosamine-6-phosphate deacetylase